MPSDSTPSAERNLAEAIANGSWDAPAIADRMRQALGTCPPGLLRLARKLRNRFAATPTAIKVLPLLREDRSFKRLDITLGRVFWATPEMGTGHGWAIPALRTTSELAAWLGICEGELDWFADVQGRNPRSAEHRLQHFTHRFVQKAGGRYRLLEVPKYRLKVLQRKLLHELIDRIPPHDAAHGFRSGRSIRSFAQEHTNKQVVWRVDLKNFFPSIRSSRIHAIFGSAGYPTDVARSLTGLCTTSVPVSVRSPDPLADLAPFRSRHLPQGAPTSPALSNLAAFGLDVRLSALALACGVTYSRYADDLAFSGKEALGRSAIRLRGKVWQIIAEEGFRANPTKTRWMSSGQRQHLTGIVVNRRLNVRRAEFDLLKAILTNCVRHGPISQNRTEESHFREHLLGRITHLASLHEAHGTKLRTLFDQIEWPQR